MKRRQRAVYLDNQYPDIRQAMDRRDLLKGLGLAGGALAVSTAAGCLPPFISGDIAGPDEGYYQTSLPPAPDVRTLYLEYQGIIDYHVVAVVTDYDLFRYLEDECDHLLDALDAVLSSHPIQDFAPGSDTSGIVAEITQTLADAYGGATGSPTDGFYDVQFIVDHYDEDEQLDGLVEDPE